jgi:hypothetical protein
MNLCYLTSSLARWLELHELSALSVTVSPDGFIWLEAYYSSLSNIFVLFTPSLPFLNALGGVLLCQLNPSGNGLLT